MPTQMPDFSVILPAAGSSTRFEGFGRKKPFVDLGGVPVWQRTFNAFVGREDVREVILVLAESDVDEFRATFPETSGLQTVVGGATRAQSVLNGLAVVSQESAFVAVHDAARPLVRASLIDAVFAAARDTGAAVPGLQVTSTVKRVDAQGDVTATIDRSALRLAQTPQCFCRKILENAYQQARGAASGFTDEASMVEAAGQTVRMTTGAWDNIKITTAEDHQLARLILADRSSS